MELIDNVVDALDEATHSGGIGVYDVVSNVLYPEYVEALAGRAAVCCVQEDYSLYRILCETELILTCSSYCKLSFRVLFFSSFFRHVYNDTITIFFFLSGCNFAHANHQAHNVVLYFDSQKVRKFRLLLRHVIHTQHLHIYIVTFTCGRSYYIKMR